MDTAWKLTEIYKEIQHKRPLVHCITNMVTVNDCANSLLALGALVTMAHQKEEVEEVTAQAEALVCNMGAFSQEQAMKRAGQKARELSHAIIIDPVGAAASSYRRQKCQSLIQEIKPTCIRGNYSEIKALMEQHSTGAGVDSFEKTMDIPKLKQYAKNCQAIVIASGEKDIITNGTTVFLCENGSPNMTKITGSGCMSSALLGAFLSVEPVIESAACCCALVGIAGELSAKKTNACGGGTMTFHNFFIDELSLMTEEKFQRCKISKL